MKSRRRIFSVIGNDFCSYSFVRRLRYIPGITLKAYLFLIPANDDSAPDRTFATCPRFCSLSNETNVIRQMHLQVAQKQDTVRQKCVKYFTLFTCKEWNNVATFRASHTRRVARRASGLNGPQCFQTAVEDISV